MCTLTVLSQPGGYLLAMTRDERVTRGAALPARIDTVGGGRFVAPRDADAGGTWIALDERGRTVCMLNGDRVAAGYDESTALAEFAASAVSAVFQSRGQLLLDLLPLADGAAIDEQLTRRLAGQKLCVRPFQLVAVEWGAGGAAITHWQFDGRRLERDDACAPWIVTSNGFDPAGVARSRTRRFQQWLEGFPEPQRPSGALLLELHRSHEGAPNAAAPASFCLHRPEVRSVSLTLVDVTADAVRMPGVARMPEVHGMPEVLRMTEHPGQPCGREPSREVRLA